MTIRLKFFKHIVHGNYGLSPVDCAADGIKYNGAPGFDPFWAGYNGIFHDVFEHYFEHHYKYFKGKYAMNVLGEIAAMGHMSYYINELKLTSRVAGMDYRSDNMVKFIDSYLTNTIDYSNFNYGKRLECNIPYQRPTQAEVDKVASLQIKTFYEKYNNMSWRYFPDEPTQYFKSVSPEKITNAYRWGWSAAKKLVPNTSYNIKTLNKFIEFWNEFCNIHRPEELIKHYYAIDFHIKSGPALEWSAYIIYNDMRRVKMYTEQSDCMENREELPGITNVFDLYR